ncbi:MAG: response regulator transcription factor [Actinobacteria bacterium]|nr:response regulator transcription factor [Actinomycetota bacterium]
MMDEKILLVEDDAAIRETTSRALENMGFRVSSESDGRQALFKFRNDAFDVVILDIMLPSLNGFEVCKELRRDSGVPIIMVTARDETSDVVLGLESGADDYVTKPFEIDELAARLRSALRRSGMDNTRQKFRAGDLEIDASAFKVFRRGEEIPVTATEFKLLLELVKNAGNVMTREMLLELVWDYGYLGDSRVVDMAIKRLRRKIEDDPSNPTVVHTVRGVGYRLEP